MKGLHEFFDSSFYISGLITYIVGVSWMIYIAWIFFSYMLSVLFFLYILISKRQEVINKL